LLLAACAPVVVTVPAAGGSGDLLPAAAQRVIDRATATAGAVATQAAQATALRVQTQEALTVEQTQVALQLTSAAGAALATDAAAVKMQDARATQVWATPTWAAVATDAALQLASVHATATEVAVQSAKSAAGTDLLRGISGAIVIGTLLSVLEIGAIAVWWANRRQEIRTEAYQEQQWAKVDLARAETERAKAEAIRAMIVERDGAPWLITPRGLVPMLPGGQVVQAENNRARERRWRAAIQRAVVVGIELGQGGKPKFGERDLAGERGAWIVNADGTPSSAGYRDINRTLRRAGVWTTAGRDTAFARGLDAGRFEREFDQLPLPELPEGEPPDVRVPVRSSAVTAIPPVSAVPQ
jgi:hypothetical protein